MIKKLLNLIGFVQHKTITLVQPKTKIKYPTDVDIFNVEVFNIWFINEYTGYGGWPGCAAGIFLRLDKLSQCMIEDYFKDKNVEVEYADLLMFNEDIRMDWLKKLENRNANRNNKRNSSIN
ncbi:MAG: hypothetical protein WC979_00260 [Candidatus Pacearchaeota archaeon]|jgi:hypothetical protein|nr:hypothetical protein [Clostridia bacterium]